ncbi:MAG: Mu transposase, C-terminal, partial [Polaromonas sp.]|nr:Mu transposase, C-terminal [Polaromonas sp.]
LQIHYEPQRSYSPTDKAQVERVFRTIKDMFEAQMPGFTGGSVHEKGMNPQNEELMTPAEFEHRLRQCIDHYNHRTHEGLVLPEDPFARLSPYMMYGILAAEVGAIPDIEYQYDWVRFLPSVTAKISSSRVRVKRLNYKSPLLRKLQGDPMVMKTGKLRIFYDPFDLRITWCFDAEGNLHPLRWHYLTAHTPRFGEFHTTHVVEQFADKKVSTNDAERILVEIFAGKYDDETLEAIRHEELADTLVRKSAARLTEKAANAAAREVIPVPSARLEAPASASSVASGPTYSGDDLREAPPPDDTSHTDGTAAEEPTGSGARRGRRALQPYGRSRS